MGAEDPVPVPSFLAPLMEIAPVEEEVRAILCTLEPPDGTREPMGIEEKVLHLPTPLLEALAHHVCVGAIAEEGASGLSKVLILEGGARKEVGVLELLDHIQVSVSCLMDCMWGDTPIPAHDRHPEQEVVLEGGSYGLPLIREGLPVHTGCDHSIGDESGIGSLDMSGEGAEHVGHIEADSSASAHGPLRILSDGTRLPLNLMEGRGGGTGSHLLRELTFEGKGGDCSFNFSEVYMWGARSVTSL